MYHIKITKLEPNPALKEWLEETKEAREYEKNRRANGYSTMRDSDIRQPPDLMIQQTQLETVVNDEEFQAIKKACLEKM